ncbi:allophanate hydrolase [Rhodococcus sp. 06-1477-1B]|nr:allophanate hydrolase [Rhodococcus sp. 06-1477-1B]
MSPRGPRAPRTPRPRRQRGAQESLGAVVLGFESIIVFLGGLVVYGLKVLPFGIEPWWGIVGGVVLAVAMVAVSGSLRHRWALFAGWGLQVVLLLGGFLVPALAVVALIFGGMWAYATIKGAALDRQNARRAASPDLSNGE